MTDDTYGGRRRDGWFSRTPGEIDDNRRAAEQAGREVYAEAIRTGQDVQARTPNELIQLGRARLAQQAGGDPIVEREVAKFNKMNQADPGDDIYLDPDLVKAQIRVESGYDRKAYNSDPMQVNKTGDWDDHPKTGKPGHKVTLGLQKGVAPGPELGIRAGLGWLDAKSYIHDGSGRMGPFIGWEQAFKRYNGGGDPHYWDKIQNAYRDIKDRGR